MCNKISINETRNQIELSAIKKTAQTNLINFDESKLKSTNIETNKTSLYKGKYLDSSITQPTSLTFNKSPEGTPVSINSRINPDPKEFGGNPGLEIRGILNTNKEDNAITNLQKKRLNETVNKNDFKDKDKLESNLNQQLKILANTVLSGNSNGLKNIIGDSSIKEIRDILSKLNTNTSLNSADLEKLKQFSDKLITNKSNFTSRADILESLELFNSTINNIEKVKNGQFSLETKFIEEVDNVNICLENVEVELNKIPEGQRTALTSTIDKVMKEYKNALNSGDPKRIALYSAFIEKFLKGLKEGNGANLSQIISEFDAVRNIPFDKTKSPQEKRDEIRLYLGDEKYAILFADNKPNQNKPDNNQETNNTTQEVNNTNPSNDSDTEMEALRNSWGDKDEVGNTIPPKPLLNNQEIIELSKITAEEIKSTLDKLPGLKDAIEQLEKANQKLVEIQNSIGDLIIQKTDIFNKNGKSNTYFENIIEELINKIIEKAITMEGKLDLSIDSSSSNISTLLEKFRSIINKLDIDTRNNVRKSIEAALISQKHDEYTRDMELRWKSIDKIKSEINKMFDELKEERQYIS